MGQLSFIIRRLNLSNVYKELVDYSINYGIIEQGDLVVMNIKN